MSEWNFPEHLREAYMKLEDNMSGVNNNYPEYPADIAAYIEERNKRDIQYRKNLPKDCLGAKIGENE